MTFYLICGKITYFWSVTFERDHSLLYSVCACHSDCAPGLTTPAAAADWLALV